MPRIWRELIKYAIAGGAAFLADFMVYYVAIQSFGLHYLMANLAGFLAGSVINYLVCLRFVFTYRKYSDNVAKEFFYFFGLGVFSFGVGEGVLFLLVGLLSVSVYPAKVLTTGFIFFLNFLTRKVVLFWGIHHEAKI